MLQDLKPTDLILDRLSDREFAREWLAAQDEELASKNARIADLEAMAREMILSIPGGHYCDPQKVADALRRIAERHNVAVDEQF